MEPWCSRKQRRSKAPPVNIQAIRYTWDSADLVTAPFHKATKRVLSDLIPTVMYAWRVFEGSFRSAVWYAVFLPRIYDRFITVALKCNWKQKFLLEYCWSSANRNGFPLKLKEVSSFNFRTSFSSLLLDDLRLLSMLVSQMHAAIYLQLPPQTYSVESIWEKHRDRRNHRNRASPLRDYNKHPMCRIFRRRQRQCGSVASDYSVASRLKMEPVIRQ